MKKIFYILFVLICLLLKPIDAWAASSLFLSLPENARRNEPVTLSVILESTDLYVNALEGTVHLPSGFYVDSLSDARSIVSVWLEKPAQKENTIHFSGIIPGGYQGQSGIVVEIAGRFNKQGRSEFRLDNLQLFNNDGLGTALPTKNVTATIDISSDEYQAGAPEVVDKVPPELFTPVISRFADAYDNKWFVSFSTQDKQTGISHYEVSEVSVWWPFGRSWEKTESPYVLKNQTAKQFVYVKALDRKGNVRIAKIYPQNRSGLYLRNLFVGIILLAVCGACIYMLRNRNKRKQAAQL